MQIDDYFKNYKPSKSQIEHARITAFLSENIFLELRKLYPKNSLLYFKNDLKLINYSAKLHDIGMFIDRTKIDKPHNKVGAKLILQNKIDDIDDSENKVVAAIIRYHRGSNPKEGKHRLYSSLYEIDKRKVCTIASILRIADSLDFNHIGIVEKITLHKDEFHNALTLDPAVNIMFNMGIRNAFEKKKGLFEKVFNVQINLKNE